MGKGEEVFQNVFDVVWSKDFDDVKREARRIFFYNTPMIFDVQLLGLR